MEKLDTTTSFNPEKQREVELFGSLFCPYTKQATRFLEEKGISYTYKEVPMIFGWKLPLKNYWEMKRRSNGMKTVPQIFISGDYYGDEERLFADDRDGRLDAALRGEPFAE
jgi:glutaredoxin